MRKFVLWLMLLSIIFVSPAFAESSGPLTGFGLHKIYDADGTVNINLGGKADYDNVTDYNDYGMRLAGLVREKYSGILPSGTITIVDGENAGVNYTVIPISTYSGKGNNFVDYNIYGDDLIALAGRTIRWNIPNAPGNAITGVLKVPEQSAFEQQSTIQITNAQIVPYVGVFQSDEGKIIVKVYFIKPNDNTYTPVSPGLDLSYLSVEGNLGSEQISEEYWDYGSNEAVVHEITTSLENAYGGNFNVTYNKGGTTYYWHFEYNYEWDENSGWSWPEYEQPLIAGEKTVIHLHMPEFLTSKDADKFKISVGDTNIIKIDYDSISCDTKTETYPNKDEQDNEQTNTYTYFDYWFTVNCLKSGRTVLRIVNIPNNENRERTHSQEFMLEVRDKNGDIDESPATSSLKPVYVQSSTARIVNGSPFYDSAVESEKYLALKGDSLTNIGTGYFATVILRREEIYHNEPEENQQDEDNDNEQNDNENESGENQKGNDPEFYEWYDYNNIDAITFDNGTYRLNTLGYYLNVNGDNDQEIDTKNLKVWWEFPDGHKFDLKTPKTLEDLQALQKEPLDITTQIETLVPYFTFDHDKDDYNALTALNWKLSGDVAKASDVFITINNTTYNNIDKNAKEGKISLTDINNGGVYIIFSYMYDGVNYRWDFNNINDGNINHEINDNGWGNLVETIFGGFSKEASIAINTFDDNLESIELLVEDSSIISLGPAIFKADDVKDGTISFKVNALKAGTTNLTVLTKCNNNDDPFNNYYAEWITIKVEDIDLTGAATSGTFYHAAEANIIGDKVFYYKPQDEELYGDGGYTVIIKLDKSLPYSYVTSNLEKFKLTVSSGSDSEKQNLVPTNNDNDEYYINNCLEWLDDYHVKLRYYIGAGDNDTITWEFTELNNINGSVKTPDAQIRSNKTQLETYKPYVKVNTTGNLITTIDWYFVDGSGKKINTPSSVKSESEKVKIDVDGDGQKDYTGGKLNIPVSALKSVNIAFTDNNVPYEWNFGYYNNNGTNLTMKVTGNDKDASTLPIIMTLGERKTITLEALQEIELVSLEPVTGNSDIVKISKFSTSNNKSVQVTLKALQAGQTNITITGYVKDGLEVIAAYPREIWVARKNPSTGKLEIPGITSDWEALKETLEKESSSTESDTNSNGWYSVPSEPEESEIKFDTENAITINSGLSVKPRYARPTDPDSDAYSSMLDYLFVVNPNDDAFTFEDYVDVVASKDVKAVFNKISKDLLSEDPRQILAVVLPEIKISAANYYVFKIPVDNIPSNTAIYFYTDYNGYSKAKTAASMTDDEAKKAISTNKYIFLNEKGQPVNVIAGEKYINAAAYLTEGTHSPIITAAATANDYKIIYNIPDPVTPVPVTPVASNDKPVASQDTKPAPAPDTPTTNPETEQENNITPEPGQDTTPTPAPTNDNNNDSDSESDSENNGAAAVITPEPVKIESPKVDITSETVINKILDTLQTISNLITGNTTIKELPGSSSGEERKITDVSAEDLAQIPDNQTPAAILPEITVEEPAIYVFGISLEGIDGLRPGMKIFLFMFGKSASTGRSIKISDEDSSENIYTFLDDDGNEITTVPENMHINVAAYMEPGIIYEPVITTEGTSANNETETNIRGGGSSGGCNAGISFASLIMLAGIFISQRKK